MKKTSMSNPVKTLRYTKCYRVASDLLILSDTTVRRSAFDWYDLKPYWKSVKRLHFTEVIKKPIIYKFFKDLVSHEKKSNKLVVFHCWPLTNILEYWDHRWELPKSGRQDSFIHIFKSSASMCVRVQLVSSGSVLQNHHCNTTYARCLSPN